MADFENLSFETPDATVPGVPDGWSIQSELSRLSIPGYGTPEQRAETFDSGWSSSEDYLVAFGDADVSAPLYDAFPAERFDVGWSNEGYLDTFIPAVIVDALYDGTREENFEGTWITVTI